MKILSIIAQKPYATGSGIYMTELMKAFDKLGHVQAAIYARDLQSEDEKTEKVLWQQMNIKNLKQYPVCFGSEALPFRVFGMSDVMPYDSLRYKDMTAEQAEMYADAFVRTMRTAMAEFQPDVVIGHHLYFATALFAENFPHVKLWGICHGTDLRQLHTNEKQKDRILKSLQNIDSAFALQEEQAREIEMLLGIPQERIEIIGNGFNADIFHIKDEKRDKACAQRDWRKDKVRLVYAGKISKSKGLLSLIRALDMIEDGQLILDLAGGFGDAAEYDEIRALAAQSKHEINFLGHLHQMELANLFNQSDIFVLPSYYEGLGLVCIEAAACGLPVVATNTAGIKKFVTDKMEQNHFIFIDLPSMHNLDKPVENELPEFEVRLAQGIAEQIQAVKEDDLCRAYLDKEQFSWEVVARKILAFNKQCTIK